MAAGIALAAQCDASHATELKALRQSHDRPPPRIGVVSGGVSAKSEKSPPACAKRRRGRHLLNGRAMGALPMTAEMRKAA
jgi:hypothetical protein